MGLEVLVELQPLGHNLPLIRVMGPGAYQGPELVVRVGGWASASCPKKMFLLPQ